MIWKRPDSSYKHSHKKITKSFEKALDIKYRIGQNSQLHSFTASQLHSFTASQLHSFTASQLHSFTASQLHSFTASQLHSFTASQLHSFTAEGFLCPNKYQLLKPRPKTSRQSKPGLLSLGFFHTPFKKPQGTQSVELRSTSQRIIKECLTKPS
ncbi:hypothetical protein E4O00_01425 [Treponema sp. OMZ 788]|uniref:hypothetical protein n=1 Tax=Treponema sp. OMZ 788 TaxID=2563664 RepID=UPI0020A421F7|nr:hypothetical protein [Treponema sp. OMZ 788]UTC63631.1 hypothetical protein E4O00_01425 [Treponema sp. OMZ 788]